jgi:hypothetical protein
MVMRRSLITAALAAGLVGSLGLAAFSQTPSGEPNRRPERTERGERGHGQGHQSLAAAAAQLGVSETDLKAALGIPAERPRPDMAAAATQLGVSETDLREALRTSMTATRQQHRTTGDRPDLGAALAAAADQLGVSETDLKAALGLPDNLPPRPDLAAAAAQLGVSETDLREALRSSMGRGRGDLQNN